MIICLMFCVLQLLLESVAEATSKGKLQIYTPVDIPLLQHYIICLKKLSSQRCGIVYLCPVFHMASVRRRRKPSRLQGFVLDADLSEEPAPRKAVKTIKRKPGRRGRGPGSVPSKLKGNVKKALVKLEKDACVEPDSENDLDGDEKTGDVEHGSERPDSRTNHSEKSQATLPDKEHVCPVCRRAFTRLSALRKHALSHPREKASNKKKCGRKPGPPGEFACNGCSRVFSRLSDLERHKVIHSGQKPFVCQECGAGFTQAGNLRNHEMIHSGHRPFECEVCQKTFIRKGDLKCHMVTHSNVKPYVCEQCNKAFATVEYLNSHKQIHTDYRPFICDECSMGFRKISALKAHKMVHTGIKAFECDECNKAFSTAGILKTHKLTHIGHRPFRCHECGKTFTRESSLKKHKMLHTGERPFVCDICSKGYIIKAEFEIHRRTHTGERPFQCHQCQAAFSRKANLQQHISAVHLGARPYICDVCGKSFTESRSLKEHKLIHSGLKPHKCKVCGRGFTQSSSLKTHMRTHSGEKPFTCQFCDKQFSDLGSRNRHHRTHTGEKPYTCSLCFTAFARREQYKTHVQKMHPDDPVALQEITSDTLIVEQPSREQPADISTAPTIIVQSVEKPQNSSDHPAGSISSLDQAFVITSHRSDSSQSPTNQIYIIASDGGENSLKEQTSAEQHYIIQSDTAAESLIHSQSQTDQQYIIASEPANTLSHTDQHYIITSQPSADQASSSQHVIISSDPPVSSECAADHLVVGSEPSVTSLPESEQHYIMRSEPGSQVCTYQQIIITSEDSTMLCQSPPAQDGIPGSEVIEYITVDHPYEVPGVAESHDTEDCKSAVYEVQGDPGGEVAPSPQIIQLQVYQQEEDGSQTIIETLQVEGDEASVNPAIIRSPAVDDGGELCDPEVDGDQEDHKVSIIPNGVEADPLHLDNTSSSAVAVHPSSEDYSCIRGILENLLETSQANEQPVKAVRSRRHLANTKPALTEVDEKALALAGAVFRRKRRVGLVAKTWICEVCGKGFTQACSLKKHIAVQHKNGKAYMCNDCGKGCSSRSELESHKRSHTGERPYKCHLCSNTYKHNADLQQHILAGHLGKRPHVCDVCGRAFTEKRSLKDHRLIHEGVKPHRCGTCGKCFTQSSSLRTHQRTHTGVKPFVCAVCGKRFCDQSTYNRHHRIHTGEKPHKCFHCTAVFARTEQLSKHMKNAHPGAGQTLETLAAAVASLS